MTINNAHDIVESNLFNQDHISKIRQEINQGAHFVSASGHGWYDGAAGFSASVDPKSVLVAGMKNWPNLSIFFVDSCYTNEFDADIWTQYNRTGGIQAGVSTVVCLGKKVVQWDKGGAVGYVGYSRVGEIDNNNEIQFWQALSIPGHEHLGKMLDHARESAVDYGSVWNAYVMNLMGDPELTIYTESPKAFTVSHCSRVYGKDKLTVSVFHQEEPLVDVNVCVSQMSNTNPIDKVYFPLVEAIEGHYTFDTSKSKDDSKIYIVITAKNFVPYIGEASKVKTPLSPSKFRTGGFVNDMAQASGSPIYVGSGDEYLYALSRDSLGLDWKKKVNGPISVGLSNLMPRETYISLQPMKRV